ncbi:Heavy-metal-associated domain-containing protein [Sulfobacillus thermosulfidooxidans DSM 9293]|uniref:Heavy-metal-associated domain-containing protein n=1 Tax=Sulfobacillus thermosulfidooxidans (strain DSM 9293 / VKM B-1269 / AT-1) TaxID=929705 RepID=A0A1W1WGM1_SULTA|nr:heavy-metal-associated domain-containing protein [Sulfobacillus thermosulfidooxidans]SMC05332.1 Heavy-metal-associated domain-containing protein [Sulfobacillus thermosulfidooxidans DSM 9293]
MERVELPVKGMTCHHCVMTVTQALNSVEGVRAARSIWRGPGRR